MLRAVPIGIFKTFRKDRIRTRMRPHSFPFNTPYPANISGIDRRIINRPIPIPTALKTTGALYPISGIKETPIRIINRKNPKKIHKAP
jgi:hypothetical protein